MRELEVSPIDPSFWKDHCSSCTSCVLPLEKVTCVTCKDTERQEGGTLCERYFKRMLALSSGQ